MPIILATVMIPACGGCCGQVGLQWACESVTGTATLCGISGYRPENNTQAADDPSAPWQYRKWRKRNLSGTIQDQSGNCTSCTGTTPADTAGSIFVYSGTTEITCAGQLSSGVLTLTQNGVDGEGACVIVYGPTPEDTDSIRVFPDAGSSLNPVDSCPADGEEPARPVTQAYTLTTRIVTACGCHTIGDGRAFFTDGAAGEELVEEQYSYDAIVSADPETEVGDSCCAHLTAGDVVSPESVIDISITGTFVRVRLFVLNGDPLMTYSVKITTSQDNASDPPTITEVFMDVAGSTVTYYYVELSEPEDFPTCAVNAELVEE